MPNIVQGDEPAWYDLRTNGRAIIIDVHPQVVWQAQKWINKSGADSVAIRSDRGDPLPLPQFIPCSPARRHCSFGGVVETVQSIYPGWTAWLVPLPYKTSRWQQGYFVAAALEQIFSVLRVAGTDTGWDKKQLLMISGMSVAIGPYGSALGAYVSPQLTRWIEKWWERREQVVRIAMRTAWRWMYKKDILHDLDNFRTDFQPPKFIHLDVPGDACGLDPSEMFGLSKGKGYELTPHNTDHPGQQLTLLTGLAKICQLAREDGF